jgi:hypothetical protein
MAVSFPFCPDHHSNTFAHLTSDNGVYVTVGIPIYLTMLGLACSQPCSAKSHESLGQPFQLVRTRIAEESTGSLTQAVGGGLLASVAGQPFPLSPV